jgi:NAD(P)-dependent dehydrogenase (short-subunit alcohol dehydrogenase family)
VRWSSRWIDRGGGAFLITASAAGLLNIVESMPYGVTKHASVAIAEWLAIAYGRRGLRVLVPVSAGRAYRHGPG